jgi:hypothetical protein
MLNKIFNFFSSIGLPEIKNEKINAALNSSQKPFKPLSLNIVYSSNTNLLHKQNVTLTLPHKSTATSEKKIFPENKQAFHVRLNEELLDKQKILLNANYPEKYLIEYSKLNKGTPVIALHRHPHTVLGGIFTSEYDTWYKHKEEWNALVKQAVYLDSPISIFQVSRNNTPCLKLTTKNNACSYLIHNKAINYVKPILTLSMVHAYKEEQQEEVNTRENNTSFNKPK